MKKIAILFALTTISFFSANASEKGNLAQAASLSDTLTTNQVNASDTLLSKPTSRAWTPVKEVVSFGIGLGMDNGGFGGNIAVYPQRNIGIFAGGGFALAGFGYNVGVKLRIVSENSTSKVTPFFLGMYGYNAVIVVKDADKYNKLFYGPTIGGGIDFKPFRTGTNYWSFGLLIPIRGSKVDSYIDDLKNNHGVEFKNDLMPIGISVAYRFYIQ